MAELAWRGPIGAASLRRALRLALRPVAPAWRVVAEDFLGRSSRIDLLAIGGAGELICIRAEAPGESGDAGDGGARLLAQGLSDLGFLAPRLADLRKLAPELGLSEVAPPRALLLAPAFDDEVRAAAAHLAGALAGERLALARYRPLRQHGQLVALLEPLEAMPAPWSSDTAAPAHREGPRSPRLTDPPSPSAFRTGLRDADLRLEPTLAQG